MKYKESKDCGIKRQKDLKVLQSHKYDSYGGDCLSIQIMDRTSGKVYAGNIHKTFNKLKDWKDRYKESSPNLNKESQDGEI